MVFLSIFCIRIFISVAKLELQAFCCCTLCRVEWFITFLIFQKKDHIAADQVYFWESYSKKLENFVVHAWHAWGKHYKHFILSPKICKTVFELEKEKKIEFLPCFWQFFPFLCPRANGSSLSLLFTKEQPQKLAICQGWACILFKRVQHSCILLHSFQKNATFSCSFIKRTLLSFTFFIKEHCVLCILLCSL